VVVLQNATMTLFAFDVSDSQDEFRSGVDDLIIETLMISLSVIMSNVQVRNPSKVSETKDEQLIQGFGFERQKPAFQKCGETKVLSNEC